MTSADYGSAKSVSSVSASSSSASASGSCPEYVTLVLDPVPWSDGYSDCFFSPIVLHRTVDNGNCICVYEYHDECTINLQLPPEYQETVKLDIVYSTSGGSLSIQVKAFNGLQWYSICWLTAIAGGGPHAATNTCWSGILEGIWGGPPNHRSGDWQSISGSACPGIWYFAIVW